MDKGFFSDATPGNDARSGSGGRPIREAPSFRVTCWSREAGSSRGARLSLEPRSPRGSSVLPWPAASRMMALTLLLAGAVAASPLWAAQGAAQGAAVRLAPTAGNQVAGTVTFEPKSGGGLRLVGEVSGLKPGSAHGFHVHEKGDCSSPDAASAGGHFNPAGRKHGDPAAGEHHAGDLPNLKADGKGVAKVAMDAPGLTLQGDGSIVGRALVVHQDADDYQSQPAGNSGARLACGVIKQGG